MEKNRIELTSKGTQQLNRKHSPKRISSPYQANCTPTGRRGRAPGLRGGRILRARRPRLLGIRLRPTGRPRRLREGLLVHRLDQPDHLRQ